MGGWFFGGEFETVNGIQRRNLARIGSDCSLVGVAEHPSPIAPARHEHRDLGLSFDESPPPQDDVQIAPEYQ
jgi:hypothetical protein